MPRRSEKSSDIETLRRSLDKRLDTERRKRREELLAPLGIEEFFAEGSITINKRTCKGVECRLCMKACPTNALFWKAGEIGLIEELCIYCGACVLNCIVDDCIRIVRKRQTGEVESFSRPRDFLTKQDSSNTKKRVEKVREAFPEAEDHLRRRRAKRP